MTGYEKFQLRGLLSSLERNVNYWAVRAVKARQQKDSEDFEYYAGYASGLEHAREQLQDLLEEMELPE